MSEDGRSSAGKMMLVGMAEWGLWMSAVRGKKDDKKREEKSQRRGGNGKRLRTKAPQARDVAELGDDGNSPSECRCGRIEPMELLALLKAAWLSGARRVRNHSVGASWLFTMCGQDRLFHSCIAASSTGVSTTRLGHMKELTPR